MRLSQIQMAFSYCGPQSGRVTILVIQNLRKKAIYTYNKYSSYFRSWSLLKDLKTSVHFCNHNLCYRCHEAFWAIGIHFKPSQPNFIRSYIHAKTNQCALAKTFSYIILFITPAYCGHFSHHLQGVLHQEYKQYTRGYTTIRKPSNVLSTFFPWTSYYKNIIKSFKTLFKTQ